ncbi:ferritin-like domain-containing protein [Larkinella humicola]|uniref:Ferritin-like domain-containing protein n=1 Tax=Larkinella humicola TaxID=2607654 RepID=A0A5N1JI81_9BACT|nr:ferritin-like domain-containing protein [Larkinella humicola]KAA9355095.1 ferritin-like domain-containing protein [Larkinella humicola]
MENAPLQRKTGLTGLVFEPVKRRFFLRMAGVSVITSTVLLSACNKDDDMAPVADGAVDLGKDDTGILNYAYALEQLEAAFYTQVVKTPYASIPAAELQLLTDIRDHEIAHREFLKAALAGAAIPALEVDFSAINFTDRASVLGAAKTFEDLGVSAYNGAGKFIVNKDYLLLAGKIVSVEARHAAAIRDLLSPKTADFAPDALIDSNGLEKVNDFNTVLTAAQPYIKTVISGMNLPTK